MADDAFADKSLGGSPPSPVTRYKIIDGKPVTDENGNLVELETIPALTGEAVTPVFNQGLQAVRAELPKALPKNPNLSKIAATVNRTQPANEETSDAHSKEKLVPQKEKTNVIDGVDYEEYDPWTHPTIRNP